MRSKTLKRIVKSKIITETRLTKCNVSETEKFSGGDLPDNYVDYWGDTYKFEGSKLSDEDYTEIQLNLFAEMYRCINTVKNIILFSFISGLIGVGIWIIMLLTAK